MDDNRRDVANPQQQDQDDDGIGDACDTDRDGDGLDNTLEEASGLDPNDPDSDDDGVIDGAEYGCGELGAGRPDTPADTDNDGIIDAQTLTLTLMVLLMEAPAQRSITQSKPTVMAIHWAMPVTPTMITMQLSLMMIVMTMMQP